MAKYIPNVTTIPFKFPHEEQSNTVNSRTKAELKGADYSRDFFYFKERRGHFDWRALAAVDPDRVIRDVLRNTLMSYFV